MRLRSGTQAVKPDVPAGGKGAAVGAEVDGLEVLRLNDRVEQAVVISLHHADIHVGGEVRGNKILAGVIQTEVAHGAPLRATEVEQVGLVAVRLAVAVVGDVVEPQPALFVARLKVGVDPKLDKVGKGKACRTQVDLRGRAWVDVVDELDDRTGGIARDAGGGLRGDGVGVGLECRVEGRGHVVEVLHLDAVGFLPLGELVVGGFCHASSCVLRPAIRARFLFKPPCRG